MRADTTTNPGPCIVAEGQPLPERVALLEEYIKGTLERWTGPRDQFEQWAATTVRKAFTRWAATAVVQVDRVEDMPLFAAGNMTEIHDRLDELAGSIPPTVSMFADGDV